MTQPQPGPALPSMAEFAAGARWETLPEAVQRESVRAWLNFVACATGGASTAIMHAAMRGVLAMAPQGPVPVFGRPERVSLADAALLNSMSTSAHTFDDTHLATITHPTGPVAAALAATAHALAAKGRPVSGPELLTALMVGMELECRISCAIAAGKANQGWYMTGLSGGIGAAAAVGRLLHLRPAQLAHAIGLAAAQACGTRSVHGSMAITFVPGVAARDGLVAAHMAQADFSCGPGAIDGRNGLLQVLTGAHDAAPVLDKLRQDFEVLNNTYKPYPCGIVIHPAIDACLALVQEDKVSAEAIERIELRVHPDALNLCWRKLPETELEAQVSLYHWVAAALLRGAAGVAEGEQACVADPAVRSLQERAEARPDAALRDNQAVVTLRLQDGRVVERFTENAIGSVTKPMTDAQLEAKFRGLARRSLGADRVEHLLGLCLAMPKLQDVAAVVEAGAASGAN
ncbi:MmgE/PrpD family protein [Siccirubricoccus sp. KC 17139]|uniref:MmgE/PrpD family protein n=1 Tax=Siccirubricoccus soli TaxID=2899147 RepID=A0ABT1D1B6_9PROT|nr:MmgE/PrpD family protein [Siccirubricoccus soli]MCO6415105.1 MmgE/PrpD family protein [Siccirubricoccus soli]MCP2681236.1 MmgE/PrpD family protein [Siccirubricoccus soli]